MTATVVQLERPLRRSWDWSTSELAEFYRVESALIQAGVRIETERGVSDEGDPWFAFCRPNEFDVIVHIARIGGVYILAGPCYDGVATGRDIAALVRDLVNRYPLFQVGGESRRQNSNIFVHPAALLIAVVATAFFKSTDARALGEEQKTGADDQRQGDHYRGGSSAARSEPYPILEAGKKTVTIDAAQTAVILTAVAASLTATEGYQAHAVVSSVDASSDLAVPSGGGLQDTRYAHIVAADVETQSSAFQHHSNVHAVLSSANQMTPASAGMMDAPPPVANATLTDALTLVVVLWDLAAKPPIPFQIGHDTNSISASASNLPAPSTLLSFKLMPPTSPDALPSVQAVKITAATVDGTADAHTLVRPDQLPTALIGALRDGAHTAIDGVSLNLSTSGQIPSFASALLSAVTTHPAANALPISTVLSGVLGAGDVMAGHDSDTASHTTSSSISYSDVSSFVQEFIDHASNSTKVTQGSQIVFYDPTALSDHPSEVKSITFDFQDGSSLSLVGLPTALPQSLLHADGAQPALQVPAGPPGQIQSEQPSGTQNQPAQSVQPSGAQSLTAQLVSADLHPVGNIEVAHQAMQVPAGSSATDLIPSAVATALSAASHAAIGGDAGSTPSSGSLASNLVLALSNHALANAPAPSTIAPAPYDVNIGSSIVGSTTAPDQHSSLLQIPGFNSANLKSLVQDFVDHSPNYLVISDGARLIVYDPGALVNRPAEVQSVSFDFSDGSTLSLVGMPGTLPHYMGY